MIKVFLECGFGTLKPSEKFSLYSGGFMASIVGSMIDFPEVSDIGRDFVWL